MQVGGNYRGPGPALFGLIIIVHLLVLALLFRSSGDLPPRPMRYVVPLEVAPWKTTSPPHTETDLRKTAHIDSAPPDPASPAPSVAASVRRSATVMPQRDFSGAVPIRWETLSFDRARLAGNSSLPPPSRSHPAAKQPAQGAFWL